MYDLSEPTGRDYKITIVGHSSVGKSKLIDALDRREGQFNAAKLARGGDYSLVIMRNGKKAAACVWDITGDPRVISAIMPTYCRNCDIVLMCFKIGDQNSIDIMASLYDQLIVECDVRHIMVVGTQADLYYEDARERREAVAVPFSALRLCSGTPCYLTSADTYEGVAALEDAIWNVLASQDEEYYRQQTSSISLVSLRNNEHSGSVIDIKTSGKHWSRRGCCSMQ